MDGHSHDTLTLQVGRTIIVQAGEFGNNLGRVDVTFDTTGPRIGHTLIHASQTTAVAADARVQAIINTYNQQVAAVHSQVVGTTAVRLEGDRAFVRTAETNLAQLSTAPPKNARKAPLFESKTIGSASFAFVKTEM